MKKIGIILIAVAVIAVLFTLSKQESDAPQILPETITQDLTNNVEITENNVDTTQKQTMKALFTTNKGTFEIELFAALAPKTVDNFTTLAESNFYDGVKFHRVIKDFMIQTGDPQSKDDELQDMWGTGGPGYQFEDEIHAENNNAIGTISMANAGPNTNGSQFFINAADNSFLDTKHTVFGKVISGMDVVTLIENVETLAGDRPVEPVIIESITIQK